jgi:peptide/nickel transport system substrate-binding protein
MAIHLRRMLVFGLLLTCFGGCSCSPTGNPRKSSATTSGSGTDSKAGSEPTENGADNTEDKDKPYQFGDLVKPFTPPSLEELDKTAKWVDRPVVDSLKLLREKQAKEKPLASAEEALAIKNQTPADNDKILSGLGRLPENEADVNWNAEINRHAYGDVNTLNPILASSVVEFDVSGMLSFGLFSFDWKMEPFAVADTVTSWQTSADGMMDKVVMRKDLTWSDGKPITAHDVVFSFKTIMTSKIPVPAMRSGTDKMKWIEAYDDYTLVYFHKEPYATNVWNLNFAVIPKHIYGPKLIDADPKSVDPTLVNDPYFVKLENEPVTGGAYVVKSRQRGQELILEAREGWYMHEGKQVRDKPYFNTVRFRIRPDASVALFALKAGDIDEMQLTPEMWMNQTSDDEFYKTNTKAYGLEWTEFHFLWNTKSPLFADKRVRQAMSYAMDYKELIEKLRYGLDKQCNGIFNPESKWYPKENSPPLYRQDLDKAEELLEAAGWTDSDGDGVRDKLVGGRKVNFEFSVLVTNKQDRVDICTLLKESLEQIQIRCNVEQLEFPALIDKMRKHDFSAAFGGWGTGTDPYTLENVFKTDEERNYGQYSNPEVDKLFVEGMKALDIQQRVKVYQKIHRILYEDQPYTWLFYQNSYYGFNRSLRGYNFSPRGPYNYGPGFSSIWKAAQ